MHRLTLKAAAHMPVGAQQEQGPATSPGARLSYSAAPGNADAAFSCPTPRGCLPLRQVSCSRAEAEAASR